MIVEECYQSNSYLIPEQLILLIKNRIYERFSILIIQQLLNLTKNKEFQMLSDIFLEISLLEKVIEGKSRVKKHTSLTRGVLGPLKLRHQHFFNFNLSAIENMKSHLYLSSKNTINSLNKDLSNENDFTVDKIAMKLANEYTVGAI